MAIACQNCNQAPATVHVTDIVPPHGEKRERHLCEGCAEQEGVTMKQHEPINTILAEFVKHKVGAGGKEVMNLTCPKCGVSFREFRTNGQLGCPHDYQAFAKVLTPLVQRAHRGATHHVGKVPKRFDVGPGQQKELLQLHRQLNDAVEREDYETAAGLRDEIKELQSHAD